MTTQEIKTSLGKLEEGRKRYAEYSKNPTYDKLGFGFNLDSRFRACEITLSLDGYSGVYGNSSCGNLISSIGEPFKEALLLWMNANRDAILDGVEMLLRDELRKRKAEELKRLADETASVEAW